MRLHVAVTTDKAEFAPNAAFCSGQQKWKASIDFCCYSSSDSRFDVVHILRCFSAHYCYTEKLSELL